MYTLMMAGLLSRKTAEMLVRQCTLHIHGRMEDYLPIYRQKYQEKGSINLVLLIERVMLHYLACLVLIN